MKDNGKEHGLSSDRMFQPDAQHADGTTTPIDTDDQNETSHEVSSPLYDDTDVSIAYQAASEKEDDASYQAMDDMDVNIQTILSEDTTLLLAPEEMDGSLTPIQSRSAEEMASAKEKRAAARKQQRWRTIAISTTLFLALVGIVYFSIMAIGSSGVINYFAAEGDMTELPPMYVFIGEDVEVLFPVRNSSSKAQTLRANFGKHGSNKVDMDPDAVTMVPVSIFNIKESTEVVLTYAKGKTISCKIVAIEPNQIYLEDESIRVKRGDAEEANPIEKPYICQPGDIITVSFTIVNESGLEFKREIVPNINNEDKETLVAFFEEGQKEVPLSFEYLCEAEGQYNITLDDIGFPLLCYENNDGKLGSTRQILVNNIEKKAASFLFTVENKTDKGFFLYLTNNEETQTVFKMYMPPKYKTEVSNLADGTYRAFVSFGEYYNSTIKSYVLPGTTIKFKEPYTFINTEEKWNKITMVVTGETGSGKAAETESVDISMVPPAQ